jgi:hypothetical protein
VESASAGYVSVAFAEQPGRMVPAEAIIGGVEDTSGECVCWAWRLSVVIVERPGPVMSGAEDFIGGVEDTSGECVLGLEVICCDCGAAWACDVRCRGCHWWDGRHKR